MIDDANWEQDMMASKSFKPYQKEFPDFVLDVKIPAGFRDSSWHNDACPSWMREHADGRETYLFIDYPEKEKRELAEGKRFLLWQTTATGINRTLVESDDFADVLAFLAKEGV